MLLIGSYMIYAFVTLNDYPIIAIKNLSKMFSIDNVMLQPVSSNKKHMVRNINKFTGDKNVLVVDDFFRKKEVRKQFDLICSIKLMSPPFWIFEKKNKFKSKFFNSRYDYPFLNDLDVMQYNDIRLNPYIYIQ